MEEKYVVLVNAEKLFKKQTKSINRLRVCIALMCVGGYLLTNTVEDLLDRINKLENKEER